MNTLVCFLVVVVVVVVVVMSVVIASEERKWDYCSPSSSLLQRRSPQSLQWRRNGIIVPLLRLTT